MKLTSHTNYALRMLMYCNSKQALATVREIAQFYNLPEKFLFKVLGSLTATGYMETVRGRSGGIRLSRPASEIRVGDVVRDVEENFELAECFKSGTPDCALINTCGLNEALHRALQAFFDTLNEYTVDDLTQRRHNIHVLLELNQAISAEEKERKTVGA